MRRLFLASVAAAALMVGAVLGTSFLAEAQQGAACPIASTSPVVISAVTTRTITQADNCKMLVFTGATGTGVSLPNAASTTAGVPVGFRVWLKAQGAGSVSATPTTSTLDGLTTQIVLTTGQGVEIRSDGTNYWSSGQGVAKP